MSKIKTGLFLMVILLALPSCVTYHGDARVYHSPDMIENGADSLTIGPWPADRAGTHVFHVRGLQWYPGSLTLQSQGSTAPKEPRLMVSIRSLSGEELFKTQIAGQSEV